MFYKLTQCEQQENFYGLNPLAGRCVVEQGGNGGLKPHARLGPLAAERCSLQLRAGCEDKETSALWESGNLVCLATNM